MAEPAAPAPDREYQPREVKSFLEHLEDLRWTLVRVLSFTAVGMLVCFPFAPRLMELCLAPLRSMVDDPAALMWSPRPVGAFMVAVRLSIWGGLILSLPFSLAVIARFVAPGLTRREQRYLGRGLVAGTFLFAAGIAAGYMWVLPKAGRILYSMHVWMGIEPRWFVTETITFALRLLVALGIAAELPAILLLLVQLGVLSRRTLVHRRRHAVVVIFVLAMMLTPPDPGSQVLLAVPMMILYEICILLAAVIERRRAAASDD